MKSSRSNSTSELLTAADSLPSRQVAVSNNSTRELILEMTTEEYGKIRSTVVVLVSDTQRQIDKLPVVKEACFLHNCFAEIFLNMLEFWNFIIK